MISLPTGREFQIGPVVTVLHGSDDRLFCPLEHLYDILGYLTGDVPTAQPNDVDGVDSIGEAIDRCRDHVARQYPAIAAEPVIDPAATDAEIVGWLVQLGEKHHAPIELEPLPKVVR